MHEIICVKPSKVNQVQHRSSKRVIPPTLELKGGINSLTIVFWPEAYI